MANEQNLDPGQQMRLNSASPPSGLHGVVIPHSRRSHHLAIDNAAVRQLYAGLGGAVLKTLSFLSLHVPLSERWFHKRMFDLRGAKRILDAGCGAGQLTRHLARCADPDASITAWDFSVEMLLRARHRLQSSSIQFVLGDLKRQKMQASNLILEGLCMDDLKAVAAGTQTLLKMPSDAKWRVSNDMMYRRYSNEFVQAVEELQKEAEENDIDGASMGWVNVTMKCMKCHKWVRNTVFAESDE